MTNSADAGRTPRLVPPLTSELKSCGGQGLGLRSPTVASDAPRQGDTAECSPLTMAQRATNMSGASAYGINRFVLPR